MILSYILFAVLLVSLVSFIGGLYLVINRVAIQKWMAWLVAFAAGSLLGVSLFDLLPEAIELLSHDFSIYVVIGILFFLIFEQAVHWHHDHGESCDDPSHQHNKATGYSVLLGDGIHNFLDGVLIASAFIADPALGIATTFAVILHEIPQELSDMSILLHSGMKGVQALWLNFISALTAIAGALVAYYSIEVANHILPYAIAIGAGGLLYISLVDLFAEVKKGTSLGDRISRILVVGLGLIVIWFISEASH
ncbi:MAG: ZIP family metal transporter [Patescibacteria group bacterium]